MSFPNTRLTRKHILILALILALSAQAVFSVTPALAATITVTSKVDTADPGRCRLRDAIIAANTNTATGDCPAGGAGLDTIFGGAIQPRLTPSCPAVQPSTQPTRFRPAAVVSPAPGPISGASQDRMEAHVTWGRLNQNTGV
jgi:hypothetical protein